MFFNKRQKHKSPYISLIAFLSILSSYCYGNFSTPQFKEYNKNNSGIPHNGITHITEDSDGFIWIASIHGLRRFDGIEFETLESITGNPQSKLLDIEIGPLFFDSNKNLWIGTINNGVYRLNTHNNQLTPFNANKGLLTTGAVREIVEDKNSNIWIATRGGINKFNLRSENMNLFNNQQLTIDDEGIYSFAYSPIDNLLWIGTSKSIIHFDASTQIINSTIDSTSTLFPRERITQLYFDGKQSLWIGTLTSLFVYDVIKQSYTSVLTPVNRPLDLVYSISRDLNNRLWVGTTNELVVIDTQNLKLLWSTNVSDSLNQENSIYHIHISTNGQLWVATAYKGLWKASLPNPAFDIFSAKDNTSIKDNRVYAIFEDENKNPLISTMHGGSDYFNKVKNQWTHFPTSYFSSDNKDTHIFSITGDNKNKIWLGIANQIIEFNTQTGEKSLLPEKLYRPPSSNNSPIRMIFYDTQQRLWVLGLSYWLVLVDLKTGERTIFDTQKHLDNHEANAFYESKDKKIWLITNQGLLSYDEENSLFEKHTIKLTEITNPAILAISESLDGSLWLGTYYGLIKYNINDKNKIENYTVKDGLSDNVIAGILTDDNNNFWLATFDGLNRFHYPTKQFDAFYVEDGLPDNEFDANTSFKSNDGKLYFAGPGGVIYFDPNKIKKNLKKPRIVFTEFKISGQQIYSVPKQKNASLHQSIQDTEHFVLNHTQNDFSFKFSLLDYLKPELPVFDQYKYKLLGYNDNWRFSDYHNRTASYSNLDADTYVLTIKASDYHGRWDESGYIKKIKITILPAPWETWWAYTLYVILILLTLLSLYKYRTTQLRLRAQVLEKKVQERTLEIRKQSNEIQHQKDFIENQADQLKDLLDKKDQIFTNISHEFRTPLTLIMSPLKNMLKFASKTDKETISMIQRNTYRLLRLVNQLLDLSKLRATNRLKPEKNNHDVAFTEQLVKAILPSFQDFAKNKQLRLLYTTENIGINCSHDTLEKIITNLLSNAIKYTLPHGEINLNVTASDSSHCQIIISDTGIGIPQDQLESVFEPFVRVSDDKYTAQVEGTGVGLSLVKELVDSCNGSVKLSSALNEGTTITVTLPIADESEAIIFENLHVNIEKVNLEIMDLSGKIQSELTPSEQQSNTDNSFSNNSEQLLNQDKPLLLIIEDNPDMRGYLKKLCSCYYDCITASNGIEGVNKAQEIVPDIIISDIMMPGKDGYDVIKTIKDDMRTSHIPVILLSALNDRENRLRGLVERADDYLTKPFDSDELLIRLDNLLSIRNLLKEHFASHTNNETENDLPIINEKDKLFLDRFHEVLEQQYQNTSLDLNIMADKLAMSNRQVQRKLKSLTGSNPTEYLRSFRIEKATLILKQGFRVEDVAYNVGFTTRNYFGTCFKAKMGINPKQYQQKILNKEPIYE